MGFFDKAKSFFGGHGVKVEITRLERQDPGSVTFPITDSVFKGNYRVSAEKAATAMKVLTTKAVPIRFQPSQ